MSDIFTLKTVPLTPELGMALKNFRIENNKTAKAVIEKFSKASSYLTKLEKGDIKKIDSKFLIELCNYITETGEGLTTFVKRIAPNYLSYSDESKLIITNIDDLLIEHNVPSALITDITDYMKKNNICVQQLVSKINANEDIINSPYFNSAPINEWIMSDHQITSAMIKLDVPDSYVQDLIDQKISTAHCVIVEAILYALYRLGDEEHAQTLANSKLHINNIFHYRGGNIVEINDDNMDNLFGGLEPEVSNDLQDIAFGLKIATSLSKQDGNGAKRIKQIKLNLHTDLGFTFAYMSVDLLKLTKKDKEKKKSFLRELRELVQKYSQDETGFDIYD